MLTKLEWDSQFYSIEIGELIYDSVQPYDLSPFDLFYLKSKELISPEFAGFKCCFQETKLTYHKKLEVKHLFYPNILSIKNVVCSLRDLYDLAYESGRYSRFKLDEKFNRTHFEKLYDAWIDNSINGEYADDLLVYLESGHIAGFISYKVHSTYAILGLLAVSPKFQGKGIGTSLLNHVENNLIGKSIRELRIPTQIINKKACTFYERQAYEILDTTYIKHYWKDDTI